MAVFDIKKSICGFRGFGWILDGDIIEDKVRNVSLAFLKHYSSGEVLELVSPLNKKSPISNTLNLMKNVAVPYHICYEVRDIDRAINILKARKYVLTDKAKPAMAFDDRRVAFMLNRDVGLIELLERE